MNKLNLGLVFGSKSPEHDVSIVTAFQIRKYLDANKYNLYLIYLDQNNQAYLCPNLKIKEQRDLIKKTLKEKRIIHFVKGGFLFKKNLLTRFNPLDTVLLSLHGTYGEDGRIQGLFEFLDIPYTGCNLVASSTGMDKVLTKRLFEKIGLKVAGYSWFYFNNYQNDCLGIIKIIEKKLKYPLFVKPANGGSSVGVSRCQTQTELKKAIETASQYDHKILVEEAVKNAIDINCAVLGDRESMKVSWCEQPMTDNSFLTFEDKYLKGGKNKGMAGLSRMIPAPIPEKKSKEIQNMAKKIFAEFDCSGVVRVDFLYQKKTGKVYPNEINTIPGSLAIYLFEPSGIEPYELIDKIIELAIKKSKTGKNLNYSFTSKLLD